MLLFAMRQKYIWLTIPFVVTIMVDGCGGGGGSDNQGRLSSPLQSRPYADAGRADIVGGTGTPLTADSVPVSVKITATVGSIPFQEVIGYYVYRTAIAHPGDAQLVASQMTAQPLLVFDNTMPLGERTNYQIVIKYIAGHAPDGTPLYKYTRREATNTVTSIEPTENATVSPDGTGVVTISVPATLGADDYVLDITADPTFGSKKRLMSTSKGPYSAPADAPRHGNLVTFGSLNVAQVFPGTSTLHLRAGARDSRNGASESINPYVFTDSQQFPVP